MRRLKQLTRLKQLEFSKDEKSAIMSDEVYMTRTNDSINTETERRVNATQVIVNVTKKIRSTRIAFAIEYKREKMRYFKFTHIVETTNGPPIVNVSCGYQIIPTNKNKVRKIYCKSISVAKITHILYILSKYFYAEHFSDFTLCCCIRI